MRVVSSIPALLLVTACTSTSGPSAVASAQVNLASPPPIEVSAPEAPRLAPRPLSEIAIVESPSSRDPFRAYPEAPPEPPKDTRPRKARRIPVDQLKLVALVTNTSVPRAMLVDPSGKGYIVTAGELVGRPEPLDGARVASFRVDRIRASDVVLVREDGTQTAPSTRVLALPQSPLLQADD